MKKHFRLSNLLRGLSGVEGTSRTSSGFDRKSAGPLGGRSARAKKTGAWRRLLLESLEERQLLAVTAAEYEEILGLYSNLSLAEDQADMNLIEIMAEDLSADSLQTAIDQAAATALNDLIVVRTNDEFNTVAVGGGSISIDLDSTRNGTLSIVGYGEPTLQIAGTDAGMIQIAGGTIQIGGMTLLGMTESAEFSTADLVTVADGAELTTSRVLYLTADSDAIASIPLKTGFDGKSGSYSISTEKNAHFSAEFQVEGSTWAYIAGLSADDAAAYQEAVKAAQYPTSVSVWYDANKSWDNDDLLCWAASTADVLYYTGWANSSIDASFTSEQAVFEYFKSEFTNEGGDAPYGYDWFLTGNYDAPTTSGWSQPTGSGGGFYTSEVTDIDDYCDWEEAIDIGDDIIANIASHLRAQYGVGLGVASSYGGHAITCWGYLYDSNIDPSSPEYYTGLIISDSDDNQYRYFTVATTWNETSGVYDLSNENYEGWYLTDYSALAEYQQKLDTPEVTASTTTTSVTLEWNAILGAEHYDIRYRKSTETAWTEVNNWTSTRWTLNNLTANDIYEFEVLAVSANGRESAWTEEMTVTVGVTQLSAPTNLAVTSVDLNMTATWTAVTSATGYQYRYQQFGAGEWTQSLTLTDTSAAFTVPTNNVTYNVQVRAIGDGTNNSDSAWSDTVTVIVGTLQAVDVPTDLDAEAIGNAVTVTWSPVNNAAGYAYQYRLTSAATWSAGTQTLYSSTFTLSELEENSEYEFQVMTLGDGYVYADSAWSNSITVTTGDAPVQLDSPVPVARAISASAITVSWDPIDEAISYDIQYKTSSESTWKVISNWTNLSYTFNDLEASTVYDFRVRAISSDPYLNSNWSSKVSASTGIVVNTLDDVIADDGYTSLREAISWAVDGGNIIFAQTLSGGTITLSSTLQQLEITKGLTIDASMLEDGITISGGNICRVFYINVGNRVVNFINLTITQGSVTGEDGGGIYVENWDNSNLILTDCTVTENRSTTGSGGGIFTYHQNYLTLNNTTISNNTAYSDGGGVYVSQYGSLTINNSTFSGNTARLGNGGGLWSDSNTAITDSFFLENAALAPNSLGGGIYVEYNTLTIDKTVIQGNTAGNGGGVYRYGGQSTITNTLITDNTARNGGGIYIRWGDTHYFTNCTIACNWLSASEGDGAGIYYYNSNDDNIIQLDNCIVALNTRYDGTTSDISKRSNGTDDTDTLVGSNNLSSFTAWGAGDNNRVVSRRDVSPFINIAGTDYRTKDYRLNTTVVNVAINSGDDSLSARGGDYDLAGSARIQGGTVDLGAYESDSSAIPPEIPVISFAYPDNFAVETLHAESVDFEWDPSYGADYYEIQYRRSDAAEEDEWLTSASIFDLYAVIAGLEEGTSYDFQIRAHSTGGEDSEWSPTLTVTTRVYLETPANLNATVTSPYTLAVQWNAVDNADHYELRWSDSNVGTWETITVDGTIWYFNNLTIANPYLFSVRAISDKVDETYDDSPWSGIVSASTWNYASTVVNTALDEFDLTNDLISLREAVYYAGEWGWTVDGYELLSSTVTFEDDLVNATNFLYYGEIVIDKTNSTTKTIVIDASNLLAQLDDTTAVFDLDGDGEVTAEIDATLLTRYLNGYRGSALLTGLTLDGNRTTAEEIEAYIAERVADNSFDIDGDSVVTLVNDAELFRRSLRGLTGSALLTDLNLTGGRVTADEIEKYIGEMSTVKTFTVDAAGQSRIFSIEGTDVTAVDAALLANYLNGRTGTRLLTLDLGTSGRNAPTALAAYMAQNWKTFDVNNDGGVTAEIDVVLLERYFEGLRGAELLDGFNTTGWGRSSAAQIESYITANLDAFNITLGSTEADYIETTNLNNLTILSRYIDGVTGNDLIKLDLGSSGRDTSSAITSYIRGKIADGTFDIDGDGQTLLTTDALLLSRYLRGLRGDNLIAGLTLTGSRSNAAEIELYIAENLEAFNIDSDAKTDNATVDVTIIGLELLNGYAGYDADADGSAVENGYGGGIYSVARSLTLIDCTVSGSTAEAVSTGANVEARGGGIYQVSGTLTISGSSQDGDYSSILFGNSVSATSVNGNAAAVGGAVWSGGKIVMDWTEVSDNSVSSQSGGAYRSSSSDAIGAGIYSESAERSEFSYIFLSGNDAEAVANVGSASAKGGGFYGGAIFVNSLLTLNTALARSAGYSYAFGGGICQNGELSIVNSTIAKNSVYANKLDEGRYYTYGAGVCALSKSGEEAQYVYIDNSIIVLNNNIRYTYNLVLDKFTAYEENPTVKEDDKDICLWHEIGSGATMIVSNYNISSFKDWSKDADGKASSNNYQVTSVKEAIGLFADVTDPLITLPNADAQAASTHEDYHLSATSLAINTGNADLAVNADGSPLALDLDGSPRLYSGSIDIGAYEYESIVGGSLLVTTTADTVDPTDGKNSLREAIEYANQLFGERTITFIDDLIEPIKLNGVLEIEYDYLDSLTIDASNLIGIDGTPGIIIDAGGNSRVFEVGSGGASFTLIGVAVSNGSADGDGGAIYSLVGETVLTNCSVTGSTADGENVRGGGVYAAGTLTVTDSKITGNAANGTASAQGGGLYSVGDMTVFGGTIGENTVESAGTAQGGGLYTGGDLDINVSTSDRTSIPTVVSDNAADGGTGAQGGGVYAAGEMTVYYASVTGNKASATDVSAVTVQGGGLYGYGKIVNSLIADNKAEAVSTDADTVVQGGGVYVDGAMTFVNNTIAQNSARVGGGIYLADGVQDDFRVYNSIVALNTADSDAEIRRDGTGTLVGNNNISTVAFWDGTANQTADAVKVKALFVNADTGDYHLVTDENDDVTAYNRGSNALIDAGALNSDLDGLKRVYNSIVDIGAYEIHDIELASLHVTTLDDIENENDGLISLREAVKYLNDGGTNEYVGGAVITFDSSLSGGTIEFDLGEQLAIEGDAETGWTATISTQRVDTVNGGFAGETLLSITVDAQDMSRVFNVASSVGEMTFRGLTITGGETAESGAGIYSEAAKLTLDSVTLRGNSSTAGSGGAVYAAEFNEVSFNKVNLISNTAALNGGAVYLTNGANVSMTFTDVSAQQNKADGDGGAFYIASAVSTVTFSGLNAANNAAKGNGGALFAEVFALTVLTPEDGNTLFANNKAEGDGGAIYADAATVDIKDTVFSSNEADGNGGAIYGETTGSLTVEGVNLAGNSASLNGGAVYVVGAGAVTLSSVTAAGNSADLNGGAVYSESTGGLAILTADDASAFTNNVADGDGGAVYNVGDLTVVGKTVEPVNASSSAMITRVLFSGNKSGGDGGAIWQSGGEAEISYAEISDNKAFSGVDTAGGGIYINVPGEGASIAWSVIRGNQATSGGGVYKTGDGELSFSNTEISENSATLGAGTYAAQSTIWANNVTVTANRADEVGGGFYAEDGGNAVFNVYNSIIVLNYAENSFFKEGSDIFKAADAEINGYNTLSQFTAWSASSSVYKFDRLATLFSDFSGGDYRLCADSIQALNTGTDYLLKNRDLAGAPRVYQNIDETLRIVDLGAYEYQGEPNEETVANLQMVYTVGEADWTDAERMLKENDDWLIIQDAYFDAIPGQQVEIPIWHDYDINDDMDGKITGISTLSLRIHYSSSIFEDVSPAGIGDFLKTDLVGDNTMTTVLVFDDTENFDGDAATDKYILITWNDDAGLWDGLPEPTGLTPNPNDSEYYDKSQVLNSLNSFHLTVRSNLDVSTALTAHVNFTAAEVSANFEFLSNSAVITVNRPTFDIDGDDVVNVSTDVNLLLRYFENLRGNLLVQNIVGPNATRDTAAITSFLDIYGSIFDISGDGGFTADVDGTLLTRYLAGFRGDSLIEGIDLTGATRQSAAEIASYIELYLSDETAETPNKPSGSQNIAATVKTNVMDPDGTEAYGISGQIMTLNVSQTVVADIPATTLSLRVHYNSEDLTYVGTDNVYGGAVGAAGNYVVEYVADTENLDGDMSTDSYIQITWNDTQSWLTSFQGEQPLFDSLFRVNSFAGQLDADGNISADPQKTTTLNFTAGDLTANFALGGVPSITVNLIADRYETIEGDTLRAFDIDGDGAVNMATDGNLLLRWLTGKDDLEAGGVSQANADLYTTADSIRTTADAINDYIYSIRYLFDIDGDGVRRTSTDGGIFIQYLSGFTGDALYSANVRTADAVRNSGEAVAAWIEQFIPPKAEPLASTFAEPALKEVVALPSPIIDLPALNQSVDNPIGKTMTLSADPDDFAAALLLYWNGGAASKSVSTPILVEENENAAIGAETDAGLEALIWEEEGQEEWLDALVNDETLSVYTPEETAYDEEEESDDAVFDLL